jgi:hypothetical protein
VTFDSFWQSLHDSQDCFVVAAVVSCSDRFGRKVVYLTSTLAFIATSLVSCS